MKLMCNLKDIITLKVTPQPQDCRSVSKPKYSYHFSAIFSKCIEISKTNIV